MEHRPNRQPDEVDIAGAVQQDLGDVIHDAIGEAEEDGELPAWGARPIARALSNQLESPLSGPLHRFAITGQADPEELIGQLTDIAANTPDQETREWARWLGAYVMIHADGSPAETDGAPDELLIGGSKLERFSRNIGTVFAEADARGGHISYEDAHVIAVVLGALVGLDSAIGRFSATGKVDFPKIREECRYLRKHAQQAPAVSRCVQYLEDYFDALGEQLEPPHH